MTENSILSLDAFIRLVGVNRATQHALFLGAGASVSSGVPSAEECIWEWKRSIFATNNPGTEEQSSELSLPSVQSCIQEWLDREGIYPSAGSVKEYGFYIEQCYPTIEGRRAYFQVRIRSARPYVGYRLLAHLAQDDLVRSVWTTNFDGLTARASADFDLTPIEIGIDCQNRLNRVPSKGELFCISLHGDYRYDSLKNTREELQTQETELRRALIEELRNTSLIVTGYSGRDRSVMETLKDAYTEQGTGTLYWCGYGNDEMPEHIADLIRHARTNERHAFYVLSQGFDDLMERLALYCLDSEALQAAKNDLSQIETQQIISNTSEIQTSKPWQDYLQKAVEHLGHEKDSVRISGGHELFLLAQNTEESRQTIFDILCAHIRQTTGESKYRETYTSKPSEEIQNLLTLLFVREHEFFKGLHINLEGSWLNGADLRKARLAKAALTQAHLRRANLVHAHLQRANFYEAQLQGAFLVWAELQGAFLNSAKLQGAKLNGSQLQGAKLDKAYLQGAKLFTTQLQGTTLTGAQLQGITLIQTHLQGAALFEAQLQGATLTGTQLQGIVSDEWLASVSFEDRIMNQVGKETNLYSSKAIFSGGLTIEAVESLVKDLPDEEVNELRDKLKPHIGKRKRNKLPEDSDVITGSYTKEEAEQWIAEYKKAMSEVPEDDS